MNDRERFIACVRGEPVDRVPYWLFWGPWRTTWERWQREAAPEEIADHRSMFDPDMPPRGLPVDVGPCPPPEPKVFEEDDETIVQTDRWGIKRRDFKHSESMSEFLEFPVKNRDDWERYKERHLDPHNPARLAGNWREVAQDCRERGYPVQIGGYPDLTFYGGVRWLLGDEECITAFCMTPDLVYDIMDHIATLALTVFEEVVKEIRVDAIQIWEDMCGRNGPLISPALWEEFMGPHYRRLRDFARQHDIPVIAVDTDGNPDAIIPPMLEAGVNLLYPFEVAAGCDVNDFGRRYPELAMMGGIDKRTLALGPAAIDAELERIRPAVEAGRYIPDLDHLIPDDVSWDNWCYYAKALKRLVGKE